MGLPLDRSVRIGCATVGRFFFFFFWWWLKLYVTSSAKGRERSTISERSPRRQRTDKEPEPVAAIAFLAGLASALESAGWLMGLTRSFSYAYLRMGLGILRECIRSVHPWIAGNEPSRSCSNLQISAIVIYPAQMTIMERVLVISISLMSRTFGQVDKKVFLLYALPRLTSWRVWAFCKAAVRTVPTVFAESVL